jgi:hypothetical protein
MTGAAKPIKAWAMRERDGAVASGHGFGGQCLPAGVGAVRGR